jgi:hypothetical protein
MMGYYHCTRGDLAYSFPYDFWVGLHRWSCPHKSGLFLPWHRAVLLAFEDRLRIATGDDSLTLPYWDWVAYLELPPIVTKTGPLYRPNRYKPNERPVALPSAAEVAAAQATSDFKTYGGVGWKGRYQYSGKLEHLHDFVHVWISKEMTDPDTAVNDPLFWFHHANVDRLWAEWQRDHPEPAPCADAVLADIPSCWKVKDLESITSCRLGYEYVDDVVYGTTDIVVTSVGFAGAPLRLRYPTPRVHLLLENVTREGDGPMPVTLDLYTPDDEQPFTQLALFGFHSPAATADQEGGHGHDVQHSDTEKGHGGSHVHPPANYRIDINDSMPLVPGESVTLRLRTTADQTGAIPTGLKIGRVSLVTADS